MSQALSVKTHAAYAALALPLAFLGLPLYIYLPVHYASLPEIGLALSGLVLLMARLLDLVTDPIVGTVIDRYRHRLSYRVVIVTATPLLLIGVWLLFKPPATAGPWYLFFTVSLTYLAWTLLSVPYYAWGAELSASRSGQVSLASWREAAVILGMLVALLAPVVTTEGDNLAASVNWMFAFLVLAIPLLWVVPKTHNHGYAIATGNLLTAWQDTGAPVRRLLALHFTNTLANGIPATLFLLYAEKALGLSQQAAGGLLLAYFIAAIVALPFWNWLAKHFGRVVAWRNAIAVAAIGFFPAALLGQGDWQWFLAVCLLTGACAGADIALPAAMQAEMAHREAKRLNKPRAASLFGLWGLVNKLALAFAVGISLPLLDLLSSDTIGWTEAQVLPWLYAGLAVLIKCAVVLLLSRQLNLLESDNETDEGHFDSAAIRTDHGV